MTPQQRKAALTKWKRMMAQRERRRREAYERTMEGRMEKLKTSLLALKHAIQ